MNKQETNDYILKHGFLLPNDQVFLSKPMLAFKQIKCANPVHDEYLKRHIKKARNYEQVEDLSDKIDVAKFEIQYFYEPAIASLVIPAGATVNLAQTHKCKVRSDYAFCWSVTRIYDHKSMPFGVSQRDNSFYNAGTYTPLSIKDIQEVTMSTYEVLNETGDWLYAESLKHCAYDPNSFAYHTDECSAGVHFFVEANAAVNYDFS